MVHEVAGKVEAERIVEKILASGRKVALPNESLDIVKLSGITVPGHILAKTPREAVEASTEIGFPLVMKISSPGAIHKTETGGVVSGIRGVQEVERNYNRIVENLKREAPEAPIAGVLLQKQIPEATHLIVGGLHDEQFGPVVMFGMGGVLVELFKDVSFRIAPVTEAEAYEMIREIKAYPVLSGYRGSKILDIKQIVKTVIIISELISNIGTIKEVELNPLLVYEKNVVAVDAKVILR
ncbi:MAG: acetyl-CoA synthetase [Planctomycetes bacterium]|nr:acetyl-CoA synthetase [Planctomycetota bacterium]